jgi:hypothetical protein
MKWVVTLIVFAFASARLCQGATDPWDASRYMRVAEVKPGMVGYGLSVFSGSKIEKFDVTVVDVVKDLVSPKCDVILIRCKGPQLDHVGPIEGMSGSPIYLYDLTDTQQTHPRLAGAYAFGFEWQTGPLIGAQPIEYMLSIPPAAAPSAATGSAAGEISRPRWSLADVPALPGFARNGAGFAVQSGGLAPLGVPLMGCGLSRSAARELGTMFQASGFDLLGARTAGAASGTESSSIRMEPGAVLVAPLLIGDTELSASGTCTEVRGNRVLGFGHEFNNEGPIRLPMGTGTVAAIVDNVHSSFKLASLAEICGVLTNDQAVGVAGTLGQTPVMVPIQLRVRYTDGSLDQTYHFSAALHAKFTPLAAAAAVVAAVSAVKDLPEYHTLDYNLKVDFADNRTVIVANRDVNDEAMSIATEMALPIMAASENPFRVVPVKGISGDITISPEAQLSHITSITLPKLKYEPGVDVKAFVAYRPWRGGEMTMPINFDLPKNLPDGDYQLVVSDWERYYTDQRVAEPFRFTAENIDELFGVVTDYESTRHNALYVRLVRQADGVAVGRTAMPRLPSSVRQAMLDGGRSDLSSFVSSSVQIIPTDMVMSGAADFTLTIARQAHLESSKSSKTAATQP